MGIEVVHDVPGVGGNYHDHVASPMHMETSESDQLRHVVEGRCRATSSSYSSIC